VSENNLNDLSSRLGLALGDFAALVTFAAIGRNNHDEGVNLVDVLNTAAPFLFSWFALSPFLGAYNRKSTSSVKSVFTGIIPGWLASITLALSIRGLIRASIPPTPFIIVSAVATFVLLTAWRILYVVLFGETSDEEYRKSGVFEIFKMIGSLVKRW